MPGVSSVFKYSVALYSKKSFTDCTYFKMIVVSYLKTILNQKFDKKSNKRALVKSNH